MEVRKRIVVIAILIVGDAVVLSGTALLGFAYHRSLEIAEGRVGVTILSSLVGWFLAGIPLGIYNPNKLSDYRYLWRPLWASTLAAPLATFLRGAFLARPILPIFVIVFGGINTLALLAWRVIYALAIRFMRNLDERS